MSHQVRRDEFNSPEIREIFTHSGPVTNSALHSSDFNTNQLQFEGNTWSSSDSPIAAFYSPARGNMKKLNLDLEKIGNQIYTAPIWACSSYSLDGILAGDSPLGKEVHHPPTPPTSTEAPEPSSMSHLHTITFVIVTCCAQFFSLCGMNQTVAPVMILAKYFDITDYGTLSWFSAAYSLTVGTFILPAGRLGDMYGHKQLFMVGWAWFAAMSFLCGFCYNWNVVVFSICRALQGVGPAICIPNAIALIGRTLPAGLPRNIAFACFGLAGPTGATAGAVFAAMIAQLGWWPWSFWILSMVCLMILFLAKLIVPSETPEGPTSSKNSRFDYLGCITGVSSLVLFNFALNQAPLVTWTCWYVPTTLGLGLLSFAAFIRVELHQTTHPLIPLRGLKSEAGFALACIAAGWSSHGIWAYYLYLYLSQVRGHTALLTAAQTSPVALTGIFFALSTVYLLRKINVSFVMLLSMMSFLIGSLLLALMPLHQTYWLQTFFSVLIMPGAMNLSFPAATILLSSALPREEQGIAASLVATMVNYCISCGLGFAGTVHRYSLMRVSEEYDVVGPLMPIAESDPVETEIRARAIRGPWFFAVVLSGIGVAVAGWFVVRTVWRRKEKQERMTRVRAEQLEMNQDKRSEARNDEGTEKGTIKGKSDNELKDSKDG